MNSSIYKCNNYFWNVIIKIDKIRLITCETAVSMKRLQLYITNTQSNNLVTKLFIISCTRLLRWSVAEWFIHFILLALIYYASSLKISSINSPICKCNNYFRNEITKIDRIQHVIYFVRSIGYFPAYSWQLYQRSTCKIYVYEILFRKLLICIIV